jgi:hypothetical protein
LFLSTPNFCSFLRVKDQVSYLYKTTDKITGCNMSLQYLGRRWGGMKYTKLNGFNHSWNVICT